MNNDLKEITQISKSIHDKIDELLILECAGDGVSEEEKEMFEQLKISKCCIEDFISKVGE